MCGSELSVIFASPQLEIGNIFNHRSNDHLYFSLVRWLSLSHSLSGPKNHYSASRMLQLRSRILYARILNITRRLSLVCSFFFFSFLHHAHKIFLPVFSVVFFYLIFVIDHKLNEQSGWGGLFAFNTRESNNQMSKC